MADREKVVGSEPPGSLRSSPVGAVAPNQRMVVTVKLRSPKLDELQPDHDVPVLSHAEFAEKYGVGPGVLDKVQDFAVEHGLVVVEADAAKRRVVLAGTASQFEAAFGVRLEHFRSENFTYRSHAGPVSMPADLADQVEAVLGLSNHPVAHPHFQYAIPKSNTIGLLHAAGAGGPVSMTADEVAKLYNFPSGYDGSNTCIAIVELGGGYQPADMQTYFKKVNLPVPTIVDVPVGGAKNTPGSDADGEVELDIQVAGTVAPKAKIAVYFADNSSQGFVGAITDAAHDGVNKPDVISISWGGPEPTWSWADMDAMNNAIRDASLLGVSVFVASGDAGSNDGMGDTLSHADFPASSPWCTACGGTRLQSVAGARSTETVWNDGSDSAGGGGVSHRYPVPTYQWGFPIPHAANKPSYQGRGVPDVAGNADPNSGFEVVVDGQWEVVGGTSAVAPLYAGLAALLVQAKGKRLGLLNRQMYRIAKQTLEELAFFHVSSPGNNGAYKAEPTDLYNCCVGLGSINGTNLMAALNV